MSERIEKAKELLERYGNDTARMLDENPELETLELFSDRRESLLDWYPFRAGAKLLLAGAGDGGLLALLLRKGLAVTAVDTDMSALALLRARKESLKLPGELETLEGKLGDQSTALSGQFDYILFDGTLGSDGEAALVAARELLSPGGTLLIAAENAYGVRAFAGQALGENALSFEKLSALTKAEGGSGFFYFPEPLKNLADTIYSERRLPEVGELSRVIPAYGFPTYVAINVGAKYNEVCRDGLYPRFADSFLVCWTKGGETAAEPCICEVQPKPDGSVPPGHDHLGGGGRHASRRKAGALPRGQRAHRGLCGAPRVTSERGQRLAIRGRGDSDRGRSYKRLLPLCARREFYECHLSRAFAGTAS